MQAKRDYAEQVQALDEIIEELEGQIAGVDFLTKEQRTEILEQLADLYVEDRIEYERKRNRLKDYFDAGVRAIDHEVKLVVAGRLEVSISELTALPKPDEDPVAELVAMARRDTVLWHDGKRDCYVTFGRDGHLENHELLSDDFEDWLADKWGETHQQEINGNLEPCYPTDEDLKKAIRQLQAYARRADKRDPKFRVVEFEREVWIDLGTPDWRAIVVNGDDWRFEERMRAPLVRGPGTGSLPIPVRGGDIQELQQFVNLQEDGDFALLCGSLAAMLNPFGKYLTYLLCGPPGSAKTTTTKEMRALTDPDEADTCFMSTVRDLMHSKSHIKAVENVSELTKEWSNALCAINTGMSYSERKYWTQGKQFIAKLQCPIIINGIPTDIVDQPDLQDRVVTFVFDYLGDKVRSDDMFWRKFNAAKGRIFGALLDGLVGAMKSRRDFGNDNDLAAEALLDGWRPRFVDAVVWAEAACRRMGFAPGGYVQAHKENKDVAFRILAEAAPICIGIRKLMANRDEWRGYPLQLYTAIRPYVDIASEEWLARDLPMFIPILDRIYGIKIVMHKRFVQNDNRNGIIIGVGRGRHFPTSAEAAGAKETQPEPNPNTQPNSGTGSVGKKPFLRRI